jgi:hypothetical protein
LKCHSAQVGERTVQKSAAYSLIVEGDGQPLDDSFGLSPVVLCRLKTSDRPMEVCQRCVDLPCHPRKAHLQGNLKRTPQSGFSPALVATGRQALADDQRPIGNGLLPATGFSGCQHWREKLPGVLSLAIDQTHPGDGYVGMDSEEEGPARWYGDLLENRLGLLGQCPRSCGLSQEPISPGELASTVQQVSEDPSALSGFHPSLQMPDRLLDDRQFQQRPAEARFVPSR